MKNPKLTQAFTIIELTAVMVIIMILASLIMGVGSTARRKAMETKTESMIAGMEIAIGMYESDTAQYPTDDEGDGCSNLYDDLTADPGIDGWRGPYMEFKDKDLDDPDSPSCVVDPWGNAYNYAIMDIDPAPAIMWGNTNSFNLWSNGPDDDSNSGDVDGDTDYGDDVYNW